jgi:deazaflavin-dependent oxidoreductase (nitroreductase family)
LTTHARARTLVSGVAMGDLRRRLTRTGNAIGVWLHRVARGRLDSGGRAQVLMVTSPGRRTGLPRSTMVRFLEHDGGYLVWGTGSGSPTDPDWFRNLRRAEEARIEIGTRGLVVRPDVLAGSERDRIWREVVLARAPEVAKYERRAGRTIPVALLRPLGTGEPR